MSATTFPNAAAVFALAPVVGGAVTIVVDDIKQKLATGGLVLKGWIAFVFAFVAGVIAGGGMFAALVPDAKDQWGWWAAIAVSVALIASGVFVGGTTLLNILRDIGTAQTTTTTTTTSIPEPPLPTVPKSNKGPSPTKS